VRGIGLGPAGLIVATNAFVSVGAGPVFGALVDRFGGRRMLATSLAVLTVGYAAYPLVHEAWQGFLVRGSGRRRCAR
jgi:MFS family permease